MQDSEFDLPRTRLLGTRSVNTSALATSGGSSSVALAIACPHLEKKIT